ncbi:hypothetical protein ES703_54179 [subsurface metagenome]
MGTISKPMGVPELNLSPPITEKIRLSEDMQQTLALLCTMGDAKRVILKASESGVLYTTNPRIKDLWGHTAGADPEHKQGNNIPCNEVMITGHPDNAGKIWVRPYSQYVLVGDTANIAWPVGAGDVINFVVSNINQLWIYFDTCLDKVIAAYTM